MPAAAHQLFRTTPEIHAENADTMNAMAAIQSNALLKAFVRRAKRNLVQAHADQDKKSATPIVNGDHATHQAENALQDRLKLNHAEETVIAKPAPIPVLALIAHGENGAIVHQAFMASTQKHTAAT